MEREVVPAATGGGVAAGAADGDGGGDDDNRRYGGESRVLSGKGALGDEARLLSSGQKWEMRKRGVCLVAVSRLLPLVGVGGFLDRVLVKQQQREEGHQIGRGGDGGASDKWNGTSHEFAEDSFDS